MPKEGTRLLFAYGAGAVAGIMQPAPRLQKLSCYIWLLGN